MTENPAPPKMLTVPFQQTFKTYHLKKDRYTFFVPLPTETEILIGRILVAWGAFEHRMDVLIDTVLPRLHRTEEDWRRLNFKKRKALFHDVMTEYTTKMFPAETKIFDRIFHECGTLHWKRNLLAHAYYEIVAHEDTNADGTHPPLFRARFPGSENKQIRIEPEPLEQLWHEIAHIAGDLVAAVVRMGGHFSAQEFVLADKDFLQAQTTGNFQMLPIPVAPQSPPQSSGA